MSRPAAGRSVVQRIVDLADRYAQTCCGIAVDDHAGLQALFCWSLADVGENDSV